MFFTKDEIFSLPESAFVSIASVRNAIFERWACTVSEETAARILADYQSR